MTRGETIKWLKSLKAEIGKSEHRTLWHYAETVDMAIEALSADVVSREVYDAMVKHAKALENLSIEDRVRIMYDAVEDIHNIRIINEVVRCKDCRWYRDTFFDTKTTPTCDRHIDDRYGTLVGGITGESFCSYGKRREPGK